VRDLVGWELWLLCAARCVIGGELAIGCSVAAGVCQQCCGRGRENGPAGAVWGRVAHRLGARPAAAAEPASATGVFIVLRDGGLVFVPRQVVRPPTVPGVWPGGGHPKVWNRCVACRFVFGGGEF